MVLESSNHLNVLQARPIKYFLGDLAQRVYENGFQAKIVAYIIARIKLRHKNFDQKYLQRGVKTNLRIITDEGVCSLFENLLINKSIHNYIWIFSLKSD